MFVGVLCGMLNVPDGTPGIDPALQTRIRALLTPWNEPMIALLREAWASFPPEMQRVMRDGVEKAIPGSSQHFVPAN